MAVLRRRTENKGQRRSRLIALGVLGFLPALAVAGAYYYLTPRSRGQIFPSGDVPIHFSDEGEGEPVILIHGFAIHGDLQWRRSGIVRALRRHFRVITIDLRGHGRSGKPHGKEHYGIELVNDVVRLMDHLGLERAHVAGYSLGGFITLKLATLHPERLLTASVLGAGWESGESSPFLKRVFALATVLEQGGGIDPPSGALGDEREKPGFIHRTFIRFVTRFMNDGAALAGVLRQVEGLMVTEDALRRLAVPLLNIAGDRDPLYVGAQNLGRAVPQARVIVLHGKTHLNAAVSRELREALQRFLLEHRGRTLSR